MLASANRAARRLFDMDPEKTEWSKSILNIFATRAASELERQYAERGLHAAREAAEAANRPA